MDLQPNKSDAILKPITNTRISASEWNQLVGSCMAFIYAAGFSPDAADNEQFLNAFKKIASELELVGANTALSNLTSEGQGKFDAKANISLDNLSSAGDIYGSKLGMPSGTYTDLTIGADGTQYTAPANGYVNFCCLAGTMLQLYNLTAGSLFASVQVANSSALGIWMPVKKGDIFSIYSVVTTPWRLRFHYAEGSKSEAN